MSLHDDTSSRTIGDGYALYESIDNAGSGETVVLDGGVYAIHARDAAEGVYCISNHDDNGQKRAALLIRGKRDLVIDGRGSRLLMHDRTIPVIIDECDNVTVRNLMIDWEVPLRAEGTVIDASTAHITVRIDEQFEYRATTHGLALRHADDESIAFGFMEFDAVTGYPAFGSGDHCGGAWRAHWNVTEVADRTVRIEFPMKQPALPGNRVVFYRHGRHAPAVFVNRSSNIVFEDIEVRHAGGMALIAQFSRDLRLSRFNVRKELGSRRVVSATADATHFVNCSGHVLVEDSVFEHQLDDAANVHGVYARFIDRAADRPGSVGSRALFMLVHFQQWGDDPFVPGQRAAFVDNTTMREYAQMTVVECTRINEELYAIGFDSPLPGAVAQGHVIENIDDIPDFTFRRNTVRAHRARGMLVQGRGRIVIEGNEFRSPGTAIRICSEANHWYESGACRDVVIRDNDFVDCLYGTWGDAVIAISIGHGEAWSLDSPEPFHANIRIDGNRFTAFDRGILQASSVDGLSFTGNTIRASANHPATDRAAYSIEVRSSRNVTITDNESDRSDTIGLDGQTAQTAVVRGNSGFAPMN